MRQQRADVRNVVVPISKQIKPKTFYWFGADSCREKAPPHTLPINEKMATSVTLIRTLQLPSNMNRVYAHTDKFNPLFVGLLVSHMDRYLFRDGLI